MPRLVLILLLSGIAIGSAFAQRKVGQARLDSLVTELAHAKLDTNRVNLLIALSIFYVNRHPDEGIHYANQSLILAQRLAWKFSPSRLCLVRRIVPMGKDTGLTYY